MAGVVLRGLGIVFGKSVGGFVGRGMLAGGAGVVAYGAAPETTGKVAETVATAAGKAYEVAEPAIGGIVDAGKEGVNKLWDMGKEAADEKLEDLIYNNLLAPLGVEREKFDKWYETLNPVALTGTFAAIKGVDFALERIGINVIDIKGAAILAIGYHFLAREGMAKQGLDYLVDSGVITRETVGKFPIIGNLAQPGETSSAYKAAAQGEVTQTNPAPTEPENPPHPTQPVNELVTSGP